MSVSFPLVQLLPCVLAAGASRSFGSIFFITYFTDPTGATGIEWIGSAIIWLLILMSVVNLGLIAVLWKRNRRPGILPEKFSREMNSMVTSGRFREALELSGNEASDFSRMLHAGLTQAAAGYPAMVRTVEQASEELAVTRFRTIEALNVLGQVSPLIGLFGTVYGVIMAFQSIASSGGNADPVVLAAGIGTALVTTFWGLVVAIPALAAYAAIRNKVDATSTEATRRVEEILSRFAPKVSEANGANGSGAAAGAFSRAGSAGSAAQP